MSVASNRWHRERREPCKGGCGVLVWVTTRRNATGYCRSCWSALQAAVNVRDGELRCTSCGEWQLDTEFDKGSVSARRGRRQTCRACERAARRRNREANLERERAYDRERYRRKREAQQSEAA